jgi:hypothetical protein
MEHEREVVPNPRHPEAGVVLVGVTGGDGPQLHRPESHTDRRSVEAYFRGVLRPSQANRPRRSEANEPIGGDGPLDDRIGRVPLPVEPSTEN